MAHAPRHSMAGDDDSMQRFMLLSSQQEVLRRRLSLQIPSPTPMTASSPEMQSLSSSPVSSRPSFSASFSAEPYNTSPTSSHPMSTYPFPTVPGTEHRCSLSDENRSEDGHKLYQINQQIKATLTELLNTDSVRQDDKFRAWIQGRLLDAEMEMRRQRRRRSSVDREIAESIAEHFEHGEFRFSP
ncbi:hypothetical protein K432DRAFT_385527 [Lepidopterella palustris CBS 459.81]|uniref:Uncharacterized protein n=1 Tax=Lepidopterella palustris CBS 459.81 TaxID=1314670 RepID=A0A8E2E2X8_9PEZI|nr:hypothetical protein K432DRAFT_385527 [Lepidopterella palustris CBS 459.81]